MAVEPLRHPKNAPIEEDLRFQNGTWIVERAGWLLMAAVVLAALLGAFGGPTAATHARDGSGRLQVDYQGRQRLLAPTEFKVQVDAQTDAVLDLVISENLAGAFEIRTISPQPMEALAHEGGVLLRFSVSGENSRPAQIVVIAVPGKAGRISGHIGLLGQAPAPLDIFVYP
ncbi:MAG: hypothetical protein AB7E79_13320 [Rhodospirillaceae bacterium]